MIPTLEMGFNKDLYSLQDQDFYYTNPWFQREKNMWHLTLYCMYSHDSGVQYLYSPGRHTDVSRNGTAGCELTIDFDRSPSCSAFNRVTN